MEVNQYNFHKDENSEHLILVNKSEYEKSQRLIAQLAEVMGQEFSLICGNYCDCAHLKPLEHHPRCLDYQDLIQKAREAGK